MTLAVSFTRAAEVVVYCALDQPYAEPVLQSFEKQTGIRVKTIYDSEAVKTAGLVNRLLAEKDHPQCDVFWNNEKLRTVILSQRGLLEKHEPVAWKTRKLPHDEKNGLWSEFAARVRVIVYHIEHREKIFGSGIAYPLRARTLDWSFLNEIYWLLHHPPSLKGKVAVAQPLFGTTSTHFLDWIRQRRRCGMPVEPWLEEIRSHRPLVCAGNSEVVRRVASGRAYVGFTDSDDALLAIERNQPVDFFFPQVIDSTIEHLREPDGTLLIPNTVAILRGAPHHKEAEALVDFLLSEATELALSRGISRQIPLGEIKDENARKSLPFSSGRHELIKTRRANEEELVKTLEADLDLLRKTFSQ